MMASYLVHYIASDATHDYQKLDASLQNLQGVQLTEELWLIRSDADLQSLTTALFSDRPPSDRFLILAMNASSVWSAANLMSDPRATIAASGGSGSVKIFRPGRAPVALETTGPEGAVAARREAWR